MPDLLTIVRAGFSASGVPAELVDALLKEFSEVKRHFYLGELGPSAVSGGRFTEAVFRILQWQSEGGTYTALSDNIPKVDGMIRTLENKTAESDSVRFHIPRTLKLIYDVRNKRNTAHLKDGIDPNLQDATLVVNNMDWVMAELVRIHHNVSASEAQKIIDDLVARELPVIQEFDGFPVVLRKLPAGHHILLLLYWRGQAGAMGVQISAWLPKAMIKNWARTMDNLKDKLFVYEAPKLQVTSAQFRITRLGEQEVVRLKLAEPAVAGG